MGYRTAELPPVELDEFAKIPFFERMKMLQLHWVEYGFGTPKQTINFYVWKIFFYALFGLIICGAFTKGLEFDNIAGWWDEPILYQKLMVWTILLEILGLAATCGPLAFHFDPPIGGVLYWWQNDTLRVPPYPNHVPFTKGNRRTPWDTGLYKLIVFWLVMMLFLSGEQVDGLPEGSAGVMPQWALVTYCGLIILMGFRDKIVFLSARSEQYVPTMLYFGLFSNFVDMIVAAKICICVIWMGAGFSKLQHGFSSTVAIMVQNTPWMTSQKIPQDDGQGLPERHQAVEGHAPAGAHRRHHLRTGDAARVAVLTVAVADVDRGHLDLDAPLLHPLHHSDRGAAGVERVLHVRRRVPVPQLPSRRGLRGQRHESGPAGDRRDRGPLPDRARCAATPVRVVPRGHEAVRRQLGVGFVLVPHQGDGGPDQRADRQGRRQPDRPARSALRQRDLRDLHPEGGRLPHDAPDGPNAHVRARCATPPDSTTGSNGRASS